MSVFIDTSAFYAVIDTADSKHVAAASTWQRLLSENEILITSSYVLTETVALLHSRFGTGVLRRFIEDNLPAVRVHWVDQATHTAALGAMLAISGRRRPSLTDCAGLEIMRQFKIQTIFAYDQHYSNLGLQTLG